MLDVLVFDHLRALDLFEVRTSLVRVPEVLRRLMDAEEQFASAAGRPLDLLNFVSSDDGVFLRSLTQKTLASALVHLGLFERFTKSQAGADVLMIGPTNGNSPITLMMDGSRLSEYIEGYLARGSGRSQGPEVSLPRLTGVELPKYGLFYRVAGAWQQVGENASSASLLLGMAQQKFSPRRSIGLGVSNPLEIESQDLGLQTATTVGLDPALKWIWSEIKGPVSLDLAN